MLGKLFGAFSHDIGIDLGTANTLVFVPNQGMVINDPSVVAVNDKTKQIRAIGEAARQMVGRTPSHIVAIRPLVSGVVSDFEITEQMLRYFIDRVHKESFTLFPRPRVVVGIPSGVTEVEKKAVEDAARNAGARQCYLIEEPMAAAIGASLPIQEATGSMVIDIGGGTTEVAVISLGGIITSKSLRIAGDELNDDIIQYAREHFNLFLGERTSEAIKINIGSAYPQTEKKTVKLKGRDLITGLPKEIVATDEQIRTAISGSVRKIVDAAKTTLEETPPELLADIMDRGIVLTGGGALLKGLDTFISKTTENKVYIADDPLTSVVRGAGLGLEDIDTLKDVLLPSEHQRMPM